MAGVVPVWRQNSNPDSSPGERGGGVMGGRGAGRARPPGGRRFCSGPPVTVVPLPAAGRGPEAPGAAGERRHRIKTTTPPGRVDCSDRSGTENSSLRWRGGTVRGGPDVLAEGTRPGWKGLAPAPCRRSSLQCAWTLLASRAIRKNGKSGMGFCGLPCKAPGGPRLTCVGSHFQHVTRPSHVNSGAGNSTTSI